MALKFKCKSKEEVPAELQSLYVERDGGFVLDVEGAVDKTKLEEFRSNNIALSNQLAETKRRFEGIESEQVRAPTQGGALGIACPGGINMGTRWNASLPVLLGIDYWGTLTRVAAIRAPIAVHVRRGLFRGRVGEDGFKLGFGDVTAEGFHAVLQQIAPGLSGSNADGFGFNAVGPQLVGEPTVSNGFAVGQFHPGPVGKASVQVFDQLAGKKTGLPGDREQDKNIQQQRGERITFLGTGSEADGGAARELRPFVASEVGQDEQRLPDISGAVAEVGGQGRPGRGNLLLVVEDKTGALTG